MQRQEIKDIIEWTIECSLICLPRYNFSWSGEEFSEWFRQRVERNPRTQCMYDTCKKYLHHIERENWTKPIKYQLTQCAYTTR